MIEQPADFSKFFAADLLGLDGLHHQLAGRAAEHLLHEVTDDFLLRLFLGDRRTIRLAGLDRRPSPAGENAFRDLIDDAVELMRKIDARLPTAYKSR